MDTIQIEKLQNLGYALNAAYFAERALYAVAETFDKGELNAILKNRLFKHYFVSAAELRQMLSQITDEIHNNK